MGHVYHATTISYIVIREDVRIVYIYVPIYVADQNNYKNQALTS